jgi:DNA-binding NarL/FixJ family response regulator
MKRIDVLLVDDHLVVLRGLRFFLQTQEDIHIVGEAQSGKEALQKIEELQPHVVLMDLMMPEMDGIETTRQLKQKWPDVKVLLLTSFSDQDYVINGLKAGASGYQLKDVEPDILVQSIRGVTNNEQPLHPRVTKQLLTHVTAEKSSSNELALLTPREKDVLKHITLGKSNKEIAADLYVSEKTVKTHVTHILGKLELQDRTQAAVHAIKQKWFEKE